MDRQPGQDNPFTPGMGEYPPYRAGREGAARILRGGLRRIRQGKTGGTLILCGPRGNGKTVLLGELWSAAQSEDILSCTLPGTFLVDDPNGPKARLKVDSRDGRRAFAPAGGGVHRLMPVDAAGDTPPVDIDSALRAMLGAAPVMLLIDEAHEMSPGSAGEIIRTARDCAMWRLPLLVVLAGTPGLEENLQRSGADFWEFCPRMGIGRLESGDEVRDALSIPAKQAGRPFDDDAPDLLAPECERYPFFVQALGYEAWNASDEAGDPRRISLGDARAGLAAAIPARKEFLETRRSEAERLGVLPEAEAVSKAIVAKGKDGVLTNGELARALGEAVGSGGKPLRDAKRTLVRIGLIWQEDDDRWESGIPSLCAYLAEHSEG